MYMWIYICVCVCVCIKYDTLEDKDRVLFICATLHVPQYWHIAVTQYNSPLLSMEYMFKDSQWMHETRDNTKCYMYVHYGFFLYIL